MLTPHERTDISSVLLVISGETDKRKPTTVLQDKQHSMSQTVSYNLNWKISIKAERGTTQ